MPVPVPVVEATFQVVDGKATGPAPAPGEVVHAVACPVADAAVAADAAGSEVAEAAANRRTMSRLCKRIFCSDPP